MGDIAEPRSTLDRWLTLQEASFLLNKSKAQVSRDICNGGLESNGEPKGKRRLRVCAVGAFAVLLEDARKRIEEHRCLQMKLHQLERELASAADLAKPLWNVETDAELWNRLSANDIALALKQKKNSSKSALKGCAAVTWVENFSGDAVS